MAAKRTIRYKGHTIRVWEQSYSVNGGPVVYVGEEPNIAEIKRNIDEGDRIASEADEMAERLHNHSNDSFRYFGTLQLGFDPRPLTLRQRLALAYDDLRDMIDTVPRRIVFGVGVAVGSLATAGFAWLIARLLY